jgi:hypothetical protein
VRKGANIRRLGKITTQVISMMLVDASLLEVSESGDPDEGPSQSPADVP